MLNTSRSLRGTARLLGALALAVTSLAHGHAERASFFPHERVQARPEYRPLLDGAGKPSLQSPRLVVCKKAGDEGVEAGKHSAALIAKMAAGGLKQANEALLKECHYEHLQAAVDAVTAPGTTIYVLPGLYREQPSIRALEENYGAKVPSDRDFCQAVVARGPGQLSYEEQFRCPHIQNTVAIFGDPNYTDDNCGSDRDGICDGDPATLACDATQSACQYSNLQIEGTGAKISDVIFEGDFIDKPGEAADGHFRYLNGIRGDRTDGLYLRNFTTQIYEFNAVYVIEADGYVFDRLLSRWVDEYAFLSFASDHGLYDYTEGYGVADSVQYPGSGADVYPNANHTQANLRVRQATEIRNSKGHHSALGYSGTAGNAPWVHNNEFYKNQTGMATESLFGGHPGMPQDHGLFENNKVYANNKDYYKFIENDGPCIAQTPRDRGVVPPEFRHFDELPADWQEAIMDRTIVCPPIPFPTGTGMIIAGGNYNVVEKNQVFDNWRQGYWLLSMPTLIHMINDPYAPKPLPAELIGLLPAPVGGAIVPANDITAALLQAIQGGTLPLLFQQPAFTSHYNWFKGNHFGENKLGATPLRQPNGVDFWWDGAGQGNCWDQNTSVDGAASADTDPLHPLPSGPCQDGGSPDLLQQLTTTYPVRILQYLPCLLYNRTDPSSKLLCNFFTELEAPEGRQGSAKVTSQQPDSLPAAKDGVRTLGYFVLHNDTGGEHRLSAATVRVQGVDPAKLTAPRLNINGVAATATVEGDTLRFSFAEPVAVPRVTATLAELQVGNSGTAALAPRTMIAGLGAAGSLGLLLMAGGLPRRRQLLLVAFAAGLALLSGCGSRSDSVDGDNGGNGTRASFSLTALEFAGGAGSEYSGLPLSIGEVNLP